jgi:uncharacterized protein
VVTDTTGQQTHYDHVIFACHADQALKILQDANEQERSILSAFTYQKNKVIVHSDTSFMPQKKSAWASWVYLSENMKDQQPSVSLSYWMNNLQNLPTTKQVFVTLNPDKTPAQNSIYDIHEFEHPVFTREAIQAQHDIHSIQNTNHISYCGAHLRYGFHEDGILSAVNMAKTLGVTAPWQ